MPTKAESRYRVVSPRSKQCIAVITLSKEGMKLEPPGEEEFPLRLDAASQLDEILSFTRATEILRRDRVKASPGMLSLSPASLHPYETIQFDVGDLLIRAERLEVLPPNVDAATSHAVSISIIRGSETVAHLKLEGTLPFDDSPVQQRVSFNPGTENIICQE